MKSKFITDKKFEIYDQEFNKIVWSSYILTPLHILTGPVGQPFDSCLGGQQFASRGCNHTSGIGILLLALSLYISYPDVIPIQRPLVALATLVPVPFLLQATD